MDTADRTGRYTLQQKHEKKKGGGEGMHASFIVHARPPAQCSKMCTAGTTMYPAAAKHGKVRSGQRMKQVILLILSPPCIFYLVLVPQPRTSNAIVRRQFHGLHRKELRHDEEPTYGVVSTLSMAGQRTKIAHGTTPSPESLPHPGSARTTKARP